VVPDAVAGEAFTKLRYDRQISGRRDSRVALAAFLMLDTAPELFSVRKSPDDCYERARELLTKYVDQAFSYVDAIVLMTADGDREVQALLTVDSSMTTFAFSHPVVVELPPRRPV